LENEKKKGVACDKGGQEKEKGSRRGRTLKGAAQKQAHTGFVPVLIPAK